MQEFYTKIFVVGYYLFNMHLDIFILILLHLFLPYFLKSTIIFITLLRDDILVEMYVRYKVEDFYYNNK